VAPTVGDRVLCARHVRAVFVLAVLESGPRRDTHLDVEVAGRCTSRPQGALDAGGPPGRARARSSDLVLEGSAVRARARAMLLAADELRLVVGQAVSVQREDGVALVADHVETQAPSASLQRAKRVFRFVSELEQLRAGVIDHSRRRAGLAALRGENTIVAARVLTKLDGEQVKIG
jgi:hypothetical protein